MEPGVATDADPVGNGSAVVWWGDSHPASQRIATPDHEWIATPLPPRRYHHHLFMVKDQGPEIFLPGFQCAEVWWGFSRPPAPRRRRLPACTPPRHAPVKAKTKGSRENQLSPQSVWRGVKPMRRHTAISFNLHV